MRLWFPPLGITVNDTGSADRVPPALSLSDGLGRYFMEATLGDGQPVLSDHRVGRPTGVTGGAAPLRAVTDVVEPDNAVPAATGAGQPDSDLMVDHGV